MADVAARGKTGPAEAAGPVRSCPDGYGVIVRLIRMPLIGVVADTAM